MFGVFRAETPEAKVQKAEDFVAVVGKELEPLLATQGGGGGGPFFGGRERMTFAEVRDLLLLPFLLLPFFACFRFNPRVGVDADALPSFRGTTGPDCSLRPTTLRVG